MLSFLRQSSNFLNKQLTRPVGCRFYQVPIFLENGEGEMGYDIYSRLLLSRIVCLFGPVTDELTSAVVSQLLFLQFQNSKEPIHMYINSIGGLVQSGLAIYDTMQCISPPVATLCVGQAISMGAFLLAAGAPGMRKALPHTTIMIHQPVSKFEEEAIEDKFLADLNVKVRCHINNLLVHHTKRPYHIIEKTMERDTFFTPVEAKKFGLVDEVQQNATSKLRARTTNS
uniref:ATP-dependent Clp protease proteolytic subunit n=1 Tax=Crassostrea virginica TaxID=6565 RepID=A0A8B8CJK2_CRAVI|nr:uncharacterized protein LOC111119810 [Crassostrea virginica]